MNEELITIAKIVRTRGLRGEVVAESLTDFPDRFGDLETVSIIDSNGKSFEATLEKFWFQNDRVILKFKGFDTIEKAEALRNCSVCISENEAVELAEGEFYDWQLQECSVETLDGTKIGHVKELLRTGGTEVLIVQGETKEYLIPFASAICTEIDIENKLIRVNPPEGLLEF